MALQLRAECFAHYGATVPAWPWPLASGVSAPHDDCLLIHVKRQEKRVKGDAPLKTPLRPEIKSALVKATPGKYPRQWF